MTTLRLMAISSRHALQKNFPPTRGVFSWELAHPLRRRNGLGIKSATGSTIKDPPGKSAIIIMAIERAVKQFSSAKREASKQARAIALHLRLSVIRSNSRHCLDDGNEFLRKPTRHFRMARETTKVAE